MPLPEPRGSDLKCEDAQIRNLWEHVLRRSAHDLTDSSTGRLQREDAVTFIRGGECFEGDRTDYFSEVCELAGVDTRLIRERMMSNLKIKQPTVSSLPQQLSLFTYS